MCFLVAKKKKKINYEFKFQCIYLIIDWEFYMLINTKSIKIEDEDQKHKFSLMCFPDKED
jgi:hypothetical protein